MAHDIGFVDNTGSEGVAHWQMLLKIKTLAEANGWTTLRYLNPTPYTDSTVKRELILQGVGLSGTEQIFVGFRAYQNQTADYYNLTVAVFTGYVAAQSFDTQPGFKEFTVCAHNQRIDYWLAVNGQRIFFSLKVGASSVYSLGYTGKILPYATPGQYPYPVVVCGTLPGGLPARRYSDLGPDHSSGCRGQMWPSTSQDVYKSPNGLLRKPDGTWVNFSSIGWGVLNADVGSQRRDTGGYYMALRCPLFTTSDVWGELDGVRYVSGFNSLSENTITLDGVLNVFVNDVWRTGINDYFLLEMN